MMDSSSTLKEEYDSDTHREVEDDNNLLMICDKTDDLIGVVDEENDVSSYDIRDGCSEILEYRLIDQTLSVGRTAATTTTLPINNNNNNNNTSDHSSNNNCQYYVINELKQNRPCLIYPKPTSNNSSNEIPTRHIVTGGSIRKRDEKRRATHNEVERRRRDKINQWIFKLKELLPADVSVTDDKILSVASSTTTKTTPNDSKSGILIKACEYIKEIQEEVESLKKCLTNTEDLHRENMILKNENELLQNEIEVLKKHAHFTSDTVQLYTPNDSNYDST